MSIEEKEEYGIVYVLSNEAMKDMVKIGFSKRKDIRKRMKELYSTGVPFPFKCEYACQIPVSRCLEVEKGIHTAYSSLRVNPDREFFYVSPSMPIAFLKLLGEEAKIVTDEVNADIDKQLTTQEKKLSLPQKISVNADQTSTMTR